MNKLALVGMGVGGAIALALGGKAVVSQVAAKEIDQAIEDVSDYVDIDYQKVDVSLLGRGTAVKEVVITPVSSGKPIKVDELVLYDYDEENEIPTHVSLAVNGVAVESSSLGENAAMFSELGYEKTLSANFATEYHYDEAAQTVSLKQVKVGADDMGDFEMSFQFSNVNLDEEAIATLPFSLLGMEFSSAKITYKDDSFVERLFETTAAAEGISVKEAKAAAIKGLETEDAELGALPEDFVQEMKSFIDDPDSFSVTFSPDNPVPLTSFMTVTGPEDVIELLNVKFES